MTKGRVPPLMGVGEIATRLGVTRSRAHQISRDRAFPEPVTVIGGRSIWLQSDVEQWISENRPDLNREDQP